MLKDKESLNVWRRAFTLMELMIVIAIIGIIISMSVVTYGHLTRKAQQARARELVSNVATALNTLYLRDNRWPPALLNEARNEGRLTAQAAACLAVHKLMSLTYTTSERDGEKIYTLSGLDRCGIVSPWATEVLKRLPAGNSGLGARVPSGGTVHDHQLHFALDDDGDGITEVRMGSEAALKVRANAVVWSWGMNGKDDGYNDSMNGRGKADDIYSWTKAQEVR